MSSLIGYVLVIGMAIPRCGVVSPSMRAPNPPQGINSEPAAEPLFSSRSFPPKNLVTPYLETRRRAAALRGEGLDGNGFLDRENRETRDRHGEIPLKQPGRSGVGRKPERSRSGNNEGETAQTCGIFRLSDTDVIL
jgi:hypothetical protein